MEYHWPLLECPSHKRKLTSVTSHLGTPYLFLHRTCAVIVNFSPDRNILTRIFRAMERDRERTYNIRYAFFGYLIHLPEVGVVCRHGEYKPGIYSDHAQCPVERLVARIST